MVGKRRVKPFRRRFQAVGIGKGCESSGQQRTAVFRLDPVPAQLRRPDLIDEIAAAFGSQCAVLALDAARAATGFEVVIRSGGERTGRDAVAWVREAVRLGAGEILLTSLDRDGTRSGYDLELIATVSTTAMVPVVASGGARAAADLLAALQAGADAVLAASIFHDGDWSVAAVKEFLAARGVEVRR